MSLYNIVSFAGIVMFMAIAWAMSANRRNVNYRVLVWGVGLQMFMAALVFCMPGSRAVLLSLSDGFNELMNAAGAGPKFLLGPMADMEKTGGFVLLFHALPMVIFFAALMGLLYYIRVLPVIIRGFAWLFTRLMRISGAESLCASGSIFVGVEAGTMIRPQLAKMTQSELCLLLTAGMATIASTVLGVYVFFLQGAFPTIAGHLISASLLSAPAAIVMAKLILPEDGTPVTMGQDVPIEPSDDKSWIEAIISGAMAGVKLLVGISALLIAFLGLLALVDLMIGGVFGWFDIDMSLARILGHFFRPLATLMGVPLEDVNWTAEMLGRRLIETELPVYGDLGKQLADPAFSHSPRSVMILAYSLCGFAHVASMAIFIGGYAALVPERRKDLAAIGPRALAAATLACLMTGAVAGLFYHGQPILLN